MLAMGGLGVLVGVLLGAVTLAAADNTHAVAAKNRAYASHVAPTRPCSSRAEPAGTPGPRDVTVGPITFVGLRRLASAPQDRFEPLATVKVPVLIEARRVVTVAVPRPHRAYLSLLFRTGSGEKIGDGVPAVTYKACRQNEKAFSYDGTVGPRTGFAAGFIVAGARCVPLRIWIAGRERPLHVRASLGAGQCR